MTILKTLTGVIDVDETTITLSDSSITDDSVIDVYFSSEVDSYDIEQNGTGVTVTISAHTLPVGVALVINNVDSVEYPITAENVSYFSSNVKLELLEHRSELNSLGNAIGLLDEEKQNNLIAGNNITIEDNVISASGGGGVNYSTTEQNTGLKWIDNRDVYQRVFTNVNLVINDNNWCNSMTYLNLGITLIDATLISSNNIICNYQNVYYDNTYGFRANTPIHIGRTINTIIALYVKD